MSLPPLGSVVRDTTWSVSRSGEPRDEPQRITVLDDYRVAPEFRGIRTFSS